jgi:hypothetical protein
MTIRARQRECITATRQLIIEPDQAGVASEYVWLPN